MNKLILTSILFFNLFSESIAQNPQNSVFKTAPIRKGNFYFYWGWNKEKYTTSDIHFWGNNYDFTLNDVAAKDKQTRFDPEMYFGITNITIPQYNWRVGYYLSNKYQISAGFDHMKYVMVNDQPSTINGYIHNTGTQYDGDYANQDFTIAQDFLLFEHTDGLNYINSEIRRNDEIWSNKFVNVSVNEGLGLGVLFPKTNSTLMQNDRNDEWHVSGFGIAAVGAIQFKFLKYFIIQSELKAGYINMPDIKTTKFQADKASQQFGFCQYNIVFGAEFPLIK